MSLHDDITKKYQQLLFEQQVSAGAEGEDPSEGAPKKKKRGTSTTTPEQQKGSSGAGAEGDASLLRGTSAASTPAPQAAPVEDIPTGAYSGIRRQPQPAPTVAPQNAISNFTNAAANAYYAAPYMVSGAPQQAQSPYSGIASDLSQQVMNRNPLGFAATLANWAGQQKMPQQTPEISRGLASTAMNPSGAPTPTPVGLNGTVAINSNQQSPSVMRATNPMQARQMQQNALNPSGAFTPVAVGLNGKTAADRPNPLAQQQSPSLWQRVKNFFGGNPTYSSGYGNNPQADASTMALQRRNAQMARTGQQSSSPARPISGAGAEGDAGTLGTPRPSTIPAKPASQTTPAQKGSSGVGAEGQLISRAPTQSSTSSGTSGLSRDVSAERQRLRDMARQVPPGATTSTRNGNTTTTTTTGSGRFVGGKLVGPDGRAVNPADQADVDAANEMRKRMQQSGGAAGGAGISGVKTFSGKPSGTSTPARPVQSRATKAVSSPQARPTGTSQTRPTGRTTTRQTTRQQPSRKPYVRGAGAEGELP